MSQPYDAFLLLSFGGPEGPDDVIPFLENVLRGKNVPRERMLEVAEHYHHFGGVSPINAQCRELLSAIRAEFASRRCSLPVYWGNRNWTPMLADTVREMRDAGHKRVLALATSAFGSYSGCRQYREDIEKASAGVEGAPVIEKLPPFSHREGFIEAVADRVQEALAKLPDAQVVYTAHSIPLSMAQSSPYEKQLLHVCSVVNAKLGLGEPVLVYQSRSGPPTQPWLGPDVCDMIRETTAKKLIVMPVGFLSDHMEVMYDLDTEAAEAAQERGIEFVRAGTVGTHPRFVNLIYELVAEAVAAQGFPTCAIDCCKAPQRPPSAGGGRPA
jgi:ferrochelatase